MNINKKIIILFILFTLFSLNILCAIWMYRSKNYKTSMFSAFASGFCCDGLLIVLTD